MGHINVKQNRRQLDGETQVELAKSLGIDQSRVSRFEKNFDKNVNDLLLDLRLLLRVCPLDELHSFKESILNIMAKET